MSMEVGGGMLLLTWLMVMGTGDVVLANIPLDEMDEALVSYGPSKLLLSIA
ncbi:MAG: hypothetical protein H7833_13340 [Magnetococcus sp. DMHC-1]